MFYLCYNTSWFRRANNQEGGQILRRLWSSKSLIIPGGLVFGTLAALMTNWGNPPNMGICVACFIRDTAGALGLHNSTVTQYIRPEIIGFLLGALIASVASHEFRVRGGSAPLIRFFLGAFIMIGSLGFSAARYD
ncbi:MAG: YeeE/YedE thiosulfate transporter family protein [Chloroflexota bacterium]